MTDGELRVLGERLRALSEQVATHHREMTALLNGDADVPFARSIRGRLHALEGEAAASKAAALALAEAQHERREAQADRERARRFRRGDLWRWVTVAVACAAIVAPYIAHAVERHP